MAKNSDFNKNLPVYIVIGLLAYMIFGGQAAAPTTPVISGDVGLCAVVEPEASFTADF